MFNKNTLQKGQIVQVDKPINILTGKHLYGHKGVIEKKSGDSWIFSIFSTTKRNNVDVDMSKITNDKVRKGFTRKTYLTKPIFTAKNVKRLSGKYTG